LPSNNSSYADLVLVFLKKFGRAGVHGPLSVAGVQVKLAAAIREGAPAHTLIAAGARWSDDDELFFRNRFARLEHYLQTFTFMTAHLHHPGRGLGARITGIG